VNEIILSAVKATRRKKRTRDGARKNIRKAKKGKRKTIDGPNTKKGRYGRTRYRCVRGDGRK